MEQVITYWEGGINWCWFTKLSYHPEDDTVTILKHWREHWGEDFSQDANDAIPHSGYHHVQMWNEGKDRIALEYFVVGRGWKRIRNQKYIFSYEV